MAELDINNYISEITHKITEENDKFIFETISPFCNEIAQTIVDKKELVEAITKSRSQKIKFVNGVEACPSCNANLSKYSQGKFELYCIDCGQKIARKW